MQPDVSKYYSVRLGNAATTVANCDDANLPASLCIDSIALAKRMVRRFFGCVGCRVASLWLVCPTRVVGSSVEVTNCDGVSCVEGNC